MKPLYSSRLRNPFLRSAFLTAAVLALGSAAAQADTHTWDDTINASWFLAGKWSPEWVNGGTSIALVNSGYVYADASVTASSLTIGDGIGSAEAKNLFNNAFAGIGSIIINSDGRLSGGSNTTTHLGSITLNGGTISGSDTGGTAALVGIFNFDDTVHVTADSTISVTGAGVTLGQTGGTQFNVDSGKTLSVTGTIVNKAPYVPDTGLIKTGDGTMNLTSTNTYTGGTTVNAG
ncbi:MAG: autotransporter-associated beta strand repeat-containing protein, partial [Verrucomicrobia bacterium]|nr:autotransporter-associated beta strand repeat-containing protein [Verrucomicrobiota bacterium]